jgi:signal peptide peptidase SppA
MAQRKPLIECLRGGRTYLLDVPRAEATYTSREPAQVVDGMAIIDVSGILMADETWWDGWGVSSYKRIASELLGAVENAAIDGILLRIDSPGGETDGAFELAAAVTAAAKQKPLWAIADGSAYSAAYLLASQATRLIAAPESGGLGSIGVYALHMDYSNYLKDLGIRPTFITAGDGKTDGNPYEPLSATAKEEIQSEVDRLYGLFVGAVANGRGISESTIKNKIGARTYHGGETLVSMGLADGFATLEATMQDFRTYLNDRNARRDPGASFAAAKTAQTERSNMAQENTTPAAKPSGAKQDEPTGGTAAGTPETTKPAAASEGTEETPQAAYKRGCDAALQIVGLCAIAKQPQSALGFLKAGKTPAAVQAALLDGAVTNAGEETASHTAPSTSAEDGAGMRTQVTKSDG